MRCCCNVRAGCADLVPSRSPSPAPIMQPSSAAQDLRPQIPLSWVSLLKRQRQQLTCVCLHGVSSPCVSAPMLTLAFLPRPPQPTAPPPPRRRTRQPKRKRAPVALVSPTAGEHAGTAQRLTHQLLTSGVRVSLRLSAAPSVRTPPRLLSPPTPGTSSECLRASVPYRLQDTS